MRRCWTSAGRVAQIAPGTVGLSVGLVKDGVTSTLVASGSRLAALDGAESLDGGTCVEAAHTGSVQTASMSDPLDEDRWHLFSRAGGLVSVGSTLSLPIYRNGAVVGRLNLYGSRQFTYVGLHEELAALLGHAPPSRHERRPVLLDATGSCRRPRAAA